MLARSCYIQRGITKRAPKSYIGVGISSMGYFVNNGLHNDKLTWTERLRMWYNII